LSYRILLWSSTKPLGMAARLQDLWVLTDYLTITVYWNLSENWVDIFNITFITGVIDIFQFWH
jgi:hypothetical protein